MICYNIFKVIYGLNSITLRRRATCTRPVTANHFGNVTKPFDVTERDKITFKSQHHMLRFNIIPITATLLQNTLIMIAEYI